MRVGSLFSGIGGFDIGFERAGASIAWQCEINEPASGVLARRFPGVPNIGDVRRVGGASDAVDLICGGFPCQDVSVAGRRQGLAGERSGLWYEFHRILAELRPRWVVIENVPGLLSSCGCVACGAVRRILRVHTYLRRKRKIRESCAICRAGGAMLKSHRGRDFAIVLRGLVELGYRVAWRILDAQYFGVAQRRRRVFIVGSLGDGRAAQVLFDEQGVPRNPPARRAPGERAPSGIAPSLAASGRGSARAGDRKGGDALVVEDVMECLTASMADSPSSAGNNPRPRGVVVEAYAVQARAMAEPDNVGPGGKGWRADTAFTLEAAGGQIVATTLSASAGPHGYSSPRGDGGDNLVVAPAIISQRGRDDGVSDELEEDLSPAIRAQRVFQVFDPAQVTSPANRSQPAPGKPSHPLAASGGAPAVNVEISPAMTAKWAKGSGGPAGDEVANLVVDEYIPEAIGTLAGGAHPGGLNGQEAETQAIAMAGGVRRLTPVECERLQGFPDHWTDGQSDAQRYRQLGNAIAVPVAEWVARRIMAVESATIALEGGTNAHAL